MSCESNLYRTQNYQNYIKNFHSKPVVAKSISDVPEQIDEDNESINSVADSLENYLDVKVCCFINFVLGLSLEACSCLQIVVFPSIYL